MISPAGFQEGFPPGDFLFTEHSPRTRLIRRALALQNQDGFTPASSELTFHGSLIGLIASVCACVPGGSTGSGRNRITAARPIPNHDLLSVFLDNRLSALV